MLTLHNKRDSIAELLSTDLTIEIKNLSFSYPNRPNCDVIQNISMNIPPRKLVAFVGKSGSGKSSLLSIISGLYTRKSGDVLIGGKIISKELSAQVNFACTVMKYIC